MNDRLKYRIFYDNKIVYPNFWNDIESIYECLKQQIMWDCEIDTDIKFNHIANNLIFMQCIGLKDKNGKLIYEGDIVKFYFDNDEIIGVISWSCENQIGFYVNTTDYFKDKYVTDYDFLKEEEYEVIGNIYENKELLE